MYRLDILMTIRAKLTGQKAQSSMVQLAVQENCLDLRHRLLHFEEPQKMFRPKKFNAEIEAHSFNCAPLKAVNKKGTKTDTHRL